MIAVQCLVWQVVVVASGVLAPLGVTVAECEVDAVVVDF